MTLRVKLHATPPGAENVDATHEVDVVDDEWLMDVCDASTAPLLFSCRSGECGICAVLVVSGGSAVDPPTEREARTIELRLPGADPRTRLGCRCRLRGAAGAPGDVVELRMLRT